MDARRLPVRLIARIPLTIGGVIALLAGCASKDQPPASGVRTLSPADFAAPGAGSGSLAMLPTSDRPSPTQPEQLPGEGLVLARSDEAGVSQSIPSASTEAPGGVFAQITRSAWVDEVVGHVNGKPIYASVFLTRGSSTITPLGPRLAREAQLLPRREWEQLAARELTRAVRAFVEDELLRAEAVSSLSTEEKQGFFAFIERAQRDLERQSGGSRAAAERRLLEEKGITIDEWRRQREDLELIRFELTNKIFQRISVSRRDIALRYQQLRAEFDKPPLATFRLIQVAKDDAAGRARIEGLLASGSFEAAARDKANLNKPDTGGLEPRDLRPPASEAGAPPAPQLFANGALHERALSLVALVRESDQPAQAGPIELSASLAWLRLDSIESRSRSLYDAQLEVEENLRTQRVERERERYLTDLEGKSSVEARGKIALRLFEIARERYYPASSQDPQARPRR